MPGPQASAPVRLASMSKLLPSSPKAHRTADGRVATPSKFGAWALPQAGCRYSGSGVYRTTGSQTSERKHGCKGAGRFAARHGPMLGLGRPCTPPRPISQASAARHKWLPRPGKPQGRAVPWRPQAGCAAAQASQRPAFCRQQEPAAVTVKRARLITDSFSKRALASLGAAALAAGLGGAVAAGAAAGCAAPPALHEHCELVCGPQFKREGGWLDGGTQAEGLCQRNGEARGVDTRGLQGA